MAKTRYPGITKLDTGRFRVRVQLQTDGARKEVDRIVCCPSVHQAAAEQRRLREDLAKDRPEDRRPRRQTLRAFAKWWLASRVLRLADSTADRYAATLDQHILPHLGDLDIDAIRREDIELWVAGRVKAGKHLASTINGWLRVLKTLMADVAAEHQLPDPTARVQPLPESPRPEDDPNALTEEELRRLLAAFRERWPQHYPLMLTMAITGLRWGEVTALKWEDLDREAGIIRVQRAHWKGKVKTTKTKRPRMVAMPKELLAVLDQWRATLVRKQHPGLQAGWCFPSRTGGPRFSGTITKPMRRCLEKAKITKRVTRRLRGCVEPPRIR